MTIFSPYLTLVASFETNHEPQAKWDSSADGSAQRPSALYHNSSSKSSPNST